MRIKGWRISILMVIICLAIYYGCTESPLGEDEISLGNRQIQGEVRLSNNMTPGDVYVWLEGFNIGTRTDEEGKFQIALPPPSLQTNSNGVTGAFNLYYFVANYNLTSTQIFTQNGLFVYSQGEINKDGQLNQPKFLTQNLRIETKVKPTSISISDIEEMGQVPFIVRVDVILQAIKDSVIVFYPGKVQGISGPLIFRNIESDEITILKSVISGFVENDSDTIDFVPKIRTMAILLGPNDLAAGEYEIIPYLLIKNGEIPAQLIAGLGENVEKLGPDYLILPIRREGNERFLRVNQ